MASDWTFGAHLPEDSISNSPASSDAYSVGEAFGVYRIVATLGEGANGIVYRAQGPAGRDVALKVLKSRFEEERRERFRREGEIAAALEHPGILRVLSGGELGGQPFLVYELVEGAQELGEHLRGQDLAARVSVLHRVAEALGYAHRRGVVHRDLKMSNVLVDDAGRVRVADFGMAKAEGRHGLTQAGAILGTPAAMAPEQITGDVESVGPPADVWALGVMIYEAICDRLPFASGNFRELQAKIVASAPERPGAIVENVPPDLEAVCLKALAKEPSDRYADGAALAKDLASCLSGRATLAARARGRRALAGVGAVLGMVLIGVALAVFGVGVTEDTEGPEDARTEDARGERERLRLTQLADEDLSAFLKAVERTSTESPLRAWGVALASERGDAEFTQLFERVTQPEGDPVAAERLSALGVSVLALGIDLSAAALRKRSLADGKADAWVARIRDDFASESTAGLERLAGVLQGVPTTTAGPKLTAGLRELLDGLGARFCRRSESNDADTGLLFLLRVEIMLVYELGVHWVPNREVWGALAASIVVLSIQDASLRKPLFLVGMHLGLRKRPKDVALGLERSELVELRGEYPKSRAVRLGLAAQLFADELWVVDARARLDVLGHLEGAVGPGDDDLALHFEADAHFMTTSVLLATWSSDPGEPRPRDPELGRRLESHVRAAHELFADKPKTVRRTYSFVSRSFQTIAWARELQGLEDEAIAVWEEGAAAVVLEAEPAGGEKKTFFVPVENDEELWNHNTDLSRLCERQALALERFKRYEDAERAFERAVAAQSASAVGMPWGPTQHFAWFLLRRSRNSEALAVCLEGFPRGYRNAALTGLTAELLSEAGDEKLKAFLDEGLRELPRNPTLTDLRSRFFPSDPR